MMLIHFSTDTLTARAPYTVTQLSVVRHSLKITLVFLEGFAFYFELHRFSRGNVNINILDNINCPLWSEREVFSIWTWYLLEGRLANILSRQEPPLRETRVIFRKIGTRLWDENMPWRAWGWLEVTWQFSLTKLLKILFNKSMKTPKWPPVERYRFNIMNFDLGKDTTEILTWFSTLSCVRLERVLALGSSSSLTNTQGKSLSADATYKTVAFNVHFRD